MIRQNDGGLYFFFLIRKIIRYAKEGGGIREFPGLLILLSLPEDMRRKWGVGIGPTKWVLDTHWPTLCVTKLVKKSEVASLELSARFLQQLLSKAVLLRRSLTVLYFWHLPSKGDVWCMAHRIASKAAKASPTYCGTGTPLSFEKRSSDVKAYPTNPGTCLRGNNIKMEGVLREVWFAGALYCTLFHVGPSSFIRVHSAVDITCCIYRAWGWLATDGRSY